MAQQTISLTSVPMPIYIISNYRQFEQGEYHVNRRSHAWILLLMLEGTLHFKENGQPVELKAGEWYFQRPNMIQEGHKPCPAPHYYYIHFSAQEAEKSAQGFTIVENGNFIKPVQAQLTLPTRGEFNSAHFIPLFNQLEYLKLSKPADLFARQALFLEIMSMLSDSCTVIDDGNAVLAKSVLDYLNSHYNEDTKINRLSEQFHFSSDYLSKLFKKHFTISPKEHIQQLRTNRAMELLVMTDMQVSQVAEAVGFRDMTVFYRTIKNRTGMSPRALRTTFKYPDNGGEDHHTS